MGEGVVVGFASQCKRKAGLLWHACASTCVTQLDDKFTEASGIFLRNLNLNHVNVLISAIRDATTRGPGSGSGGGYFIPWGTSLFLLHKTEINLVVYELWIV